MALKLTVHFNCSTKVAYVKDDSSYSSPSSVRKYVFGRLNYPNGDSVFNKNDVNNTNNPLISFNSIPRVSSNYTLANMPAGNYTFSGTVFYEYSNQNANPLNQTVLFTSANTFSILNANLTEALFVGSEITIASATNNANNGQYNVTAVEFISGSTRVTIQQNTLVQNVNVDTSAEVTFETNVLVSDNVIYNYSTCANTLCLDLSFTYDAFSTQYGSATLSDNTNYYGWDIESRQLSLYYPAGLDPAPASNPVTTTTPNITLTELATGIYTNKLVVTASYVQNDGLVLDSTATKIKQSTVIAYTEMCGIQDCITRMLDRHVAYLKSATVSPLQQFVDQVYGLYINAKEALACGNKTSYSSYVSQIYAILGTTQDDCGTCSCGGSCSDCNDSCGCGQPDEPVWIDNLGLNIDSLLAEFQDFMENELPDLLDLQDQVDDLQVDVTALQEEVSDLTTTVSGLGIQSETNTEDISGLQSDVTTLQSDVTVLQQEIAEFSPTNSEIVLNELLTNDGSQPLNYTAISGFPIAQSLTTKYGITLSGDVSSEFANNEVIVFFSPIDNVWYEGTITSVDYKTSTSQTQLTLTSSTPVYWVSINTNFYIFKANPSESDYYFGKQITISNNSFWKYADPSNKYWSKIRSSFLYNGSVSNVFDIFNVTTNQYLTLKDINPGSIVDLELTMEKKYDSTSASYDLVYFLDVKVNSSRNSENVNNVMTHAGCTGYVPYGYVDLYQNVDAPDNYSFSNLSVTTRSGLLSPTQDVLSTSGGQNINRLMTRFASGPNYPNTALSQQFFSGNVNNVINFNNDNVNIVLLNLEVSYGKMPA
jgi:hypothetical protein